MYNHAWCCTIRQVNPLQEKRWALYILPQYFGNLIRPSGISKTLFGGEGGGEIFPHMNNTDFFKPHLILRLLLYVFVSYFVFSFVFFLEQGVGRGKICQLQSFGVQWLGEFRH